MKTLRTHFRHSRLDSWRRRVLRVGLLRPCVVNSTMPKKSLLRRGGSGLTGTGFSDNADFRGRENNQSSNECSGTRCLFLTSMDIHNSQLEWPPGASFWPCEGVFGFKDQLADVAQHHDGFPAVDCFPAPNRRGPQMDSGPGSASSSGRAAPAPYFENIRQAI